MMTKPSAGNTGRHTSHVESLRDDAYSSILPPAKTCGCVTLSCPHEPDPLGLTAQSANGTEAVCARHDSHDFKSWEDEDSRCDGCGATRDDPEAFMLCQMVDIKPDYDAILLASRRRREAESAQSNFPLKSESSNSESVQSLSRAMSRPITFTPRVGMRT